MYDYLVIGSGIIGAFISHELSKYDTTVLVLEKENDISDGTSKANSAIVHSGYDPEPGTLKAKLNVKGNKMYRRLCKYYGIPFYDTGSLTLAFTEEEVQNLEELRKRAETNGVEVDILTSDEVLKKEPSINKNVKKALYAPTAGVVYPWQMAMALFDHSISNGVDLRLNQEVKSIEKVDEHYLVKTQNSEYEVKNIINCAGVYGAKIASMTLDNQYSIKPRKGEYYVLERGANTYINHVLFPMPSDKGKGVLAVPISDREILLGPTSEPEEDYDDKSTSYEGLKEIKDSLSHMLENVPLNRTMTSFSGLRASEAGGDFVIEKSKNSKGVYHIIGIQSPGFASAPAIARYFIEEVSEIDKKLARKADYKEYKPTSRVVQIQTKEERGRKIKEDKEYGKIICRCEGISLKEIKEAIHGNVGTDTITGVKRRVRCGAGKCQGGFCEPSIAKIIASETGKDILEVENDKVGSYLLVGHSKEDL